MTLILKVRPMVMMFRSLLTTKLKRTTENGGVCWLHLVVDGFGIPMSLAMPKL